MGNLADNEDIAKFVSRLISYYNESFSDDSKMAYLQNVRMFLIKRKITTERLNKLYAHLITNVPRQYRTCPGIDSMVVALRELPAASHALLPFSDEPDPELADVLSTFLDAKLKGKNPLEEEKIKAVLQGE